MAVVNGTISNAQVTIISLSVDIPSIVRPFIFTVVEILNLQLTPPPPPYRTN